MDFREPAFRFLRDAPAENDFGSGACQSDGHGAAEFAGAADYDGDFSGQVK
jgi:hypothetical protein